MIPQKVRQKWVRGHVVTATTRQERHSYTNGIFGKNCKKEGEKKKTSFSEGRQRFGTDLNGKKVQTPTAEQWFCPVALEL